MPLASPSPWMPELCRLPRLAAMLGLAELVVVVLALAPDGSRHWNRWRAAVSQRLRLVAGAGRDRQPVPAAAGLSRLPQVMGAALPSHWRP